MKKGLKIVLSILICTMLFSSLVGCGNQSNEKGDKVDKQDNKKEVKTLKITMHASWYGKGWQAVEKDINERTEELGYKLDFDKIAEGEQGTQILQTRAAAGDLPDILCTNGLQGIDSDLHCIDKVIDLTDQDWTKNYDDKILKSNYGYNEKILAMPLGGTNFPGIFYNKKVFSDLDIEIPTDWDEFLSACEKIKAAGKVPFYVAGKDSWTVQIFNIAGLQREYKGKDISKEYIDLMTNKTNIVDYDKLKDSYAKLKELKDKGYIQENWLSDNYEGQQKAIVDGTAGMTCNATWMMEEIQKSYPDKVDDVGGFSPVFDGDDPIGAWIPNAMLGFNTSKNIDEVKDFLNYFGSIETQTLYFNAQPAIPIAKGIEVKGLSGASQDIYNEFLNPDRGQTIWQSVPMPEGVEYVALGDFPEYSINVLLGERTPEETLQDIREFMEKDAKTKGVKGW